jgi:Sec-independent protein secretion pathway component TatC
MALPLRPVSHEARLPLLEHVGELRARLVITLAAPLNVAERQALNSAAQADAAVVAASPSQPQGRQPVTLGLGEPFTQTLTVAGYFALLLALPVVLGSSTPSSSPPSASASAASRCH